MNITGLQGQSLGSLYEASVDPELYIGQRIWKASMEINSIALSIANSIELWPLRVQ